MRAATEMFREQPNGPAISLIPEIFVSAPGSGATVSFVTG